MRTHTRKVRRGGRRANGAAGANAEAPISTNPAIRIERVTNPDGEKIDFLAYGKLNQAVLNAIKNNSSLKEKRSNLEKERLIVYMTVSKMGGETAVKKAVKIQKKGIDIDPKKTVYLDTINNVSGSITTNQTKGTSINKKNIASIFKNEVLVGNNPPLYTPFTSIGNTTPYYLFKKGTGTQVARDVLNYLKDQGVETVILVPLNKTLETYYARLGFTPVDDVEHNLLPGWKFGQGEGEGRIMYKKL